MLVIIINDDPANYNEPHQGWRGSFFFTGRGGAGKRSKTAGQGGARAGNILCI